MPPKKKKEAKKKVEREETTDPRKSDLLPKIGIEPVEGTNLDYTRPETESEHIEKISEHQLKVRTKQLKQSGRKKTTLRPRAPTSRTNYSLTSDSVKPLTPRLSTKTRTLTTTSSVTSTSVLDMDVYQDILTLTIPETTQNIIHCVIGKDLFVDKTWCFVKKSHLLEDIAIEETNSPFYYLNQKILEYKPSEFMIGYEPFSSVPNQFMLCLTEKGRDDVVSQLEEMKNKFIQRIEQSKEIEPGKWQSLGSEEFVNQFQIKHTRKPISLEWIGDIRKRCFTEPVFTDCDPDDMKNGYTCLVPSEKEKFDLIFRKTQETGVQAVASREEVSVQTEPAIPTNASTQYAPETEISATGDKATESAVTSQDLNTFFNKYIDYLTECLKYNEVYDLYHDDYPALYVPGEETQVQQVGTYHQYQSFTDVAAVEGKLVISTSWHPQYTGIVAIAYAKEIPCLMTELEFDSDQTDYEEEKTDEEGEEADEPELSQGARDWLEDEKRERESTSENTDMYDRAVKRLKDIEATKIVWDAKIQEAEEEMRRPVEAADSDNQLALFVYREYEEVEPEPEPEPEVEVVVEGEGVAKSEAGQEEEAESQVEKEEEVFGILGKDESASQKTSKASLWEQLASDIEETRQSAEEPASLSLADDFFDRTKLKVQDTDSFQLQASESVKSTSLLPHRSQSDEGASRKIAHHKKKHRQNVPRDIRLKQVDQESIDTMPSGSGVSSSTSEGRHDLAKDATYYDQEYFDEVTDEEEMKEKREEHPLLETNNPVLIWSFVDDLSPKLRLDSPYEVRVVSFSRHDGNLIAGGTASGQVVVWDITGRIEQLEKPDILTQNQQTFRKRMEYLMNWRKDVRSKRRVPVSAISMQKESHMERVTSLTWISPVVMVTNTADIISNPDPSTPNLQLLTSSISGDIKVWDLRMDPVKVDNKKQLTLFKTKERFGRPAALDKDVSPFSRLHKRWKPHVWFKTIYKGLPLQITTIDPHTMPHMYVRRRPRLPGVKEALEDRIEYRCVYGDFRPIPLQMFSGDLFGEAATITWEPPKEKLQDVENLRHTCQFWDSYHDGPIYRVSRHPFIPSVCLTVGGHVFAIWHLDNKEDPIMTKRYYGAYVTDGIWSPLRPSMIRIARSDGVVEIWDLIIQTHAPATTIVVSGKVITNISPPLLPEARGLLGVADYNSAFRLFFIPQQFRVWSEDELVRVKNMFNTEPHRKKKMKEWSKWWRENNVNPDREEKKQAEEKKKMDEESRIEKEKQEEAKKKYNKEVYRWYMRRRGKPFMLDEEAEEKWHQKEEQHMHEVVMAKKKIDRSEMEILMKPIVREEKNESQKHAKAQERLKQADAIFRQTVDLIFPKTDRKVSTSSKEKEKFNEEFSALIDHYFGENFEQLADEQEEIIKRSPWQFDFEWSELLDKYNALRMLFNDRRRKRSKTLRWLRKKLREELMSEGRKVHIRKSHMARYPKRKIRRRQENLELLKEMYGDDYNVYWDKNHPCRRFVDRKFRTPIEETDSHFLGELSEPDVEDEEVASLFIEEKVRSTLEMMTEVGIEHVPEEMFSADLDTALITLESRSSLGIKTVPSLIARKASVSTDKPSGSITERTLQVYQMPQSPQDESDMSLTLDGEDDKLMVMDNQKEELDYIQQPSGTKINTLQVKKVASHQRHEISEGIKIKVDDSSLEEMEIEQSSQVSLKVTGAEEEEGKTDDVKEELKDSADQDGVSPGPDQEIKGIGEEKIE